MFHQREKNCEAFWQWNLGNTSMELRFWITGCSSNASPVDQPQTSTGQWRPKQYMHYQEQSNDGSWNWQLNFSPMVPVWHAGNYAHKPNAHAAHASRKIKTTYSDVQPSQQSLLGIKHLRNWTIGYMHPQLRHKILDRLRRWHDEQPPGIPDLAELTASSLQAQLGWRIALEGCLVQWWHEEQDIFWKTIKSRKSSKWWTVALITQLVTTAWDMWQHHNKALHELDLNKQDILEDAINTQICQVYETGKANLPRAAWP